MTIKDDVDGYLDVSDTAEFDRDMEQIVNDSLEDISHWNDDSKNPFNVGAPMAEKLFEVQTRSEENGLRYFPTLKDAIQHALSDKTVWKISFSLPNGEQVRMVAQIAFEDIQGDNVYDWVYEPIFLGQDETLKEDLKGYDHLGSERSKA